MSEQCHTQCYTNQLSWLNSCGNEGLFHPAAMNDKAVINDKGLDPCRLRYRHRSALAIFSKLCNSGLRRTLRIGEVTCRPCGKRGLPFVQRPIADSDSFLVLIKNVIYSPTVVCASYPNHTGLGQFAEQLPRELSTQGHRVNQESHVARTTRSTVMP